MGKHAKTEAPFSEGFSLGMFLIPACLLLK